MRLLITSLYVMLFPEKLTIWSKMERASRSAPSAFCAMMLRASSSAVMFSFAAMFCRCLLISSTVILLKSNIWHRDRIVGMILCFSVVARMNFAYAGGSSNVLRKALKAACESMWTSSMIYTLYFPTWGGILTWSTRLRMSSTELFDAASNS